MKFAISLSCGKNSIYALDRMIEAGNELGAIIVSCSCLSNRSCFHGADIDLLRLYADNYCAPLILSFNNGEDYSEKFEESLKEAKGLGCEAVVFGDISLSSSKKWNEKRSLNAGLNPIFPLWKIDKEEYLQSIFSLGYEVLIKVVDLDVLDKAYLGRVLDEEVVRKLTESDIDICGDNGEYHTLVLNGPGFKKKISMDIGNIGISGHCAYIESSVKE